MAPAQLLNHDIPVDHDFTHVNRVVASDFVVLNALIFALVTIRKPIHSMLEYLY